jgi:hypothetical protein
MIQQFARLARVFAGDKVNGSQGFHRSRRNILQVSDWCGDKIKRSGHLPIVCKKGKRLLFSL